MKLGVITPVGPGHEGAYEACRQSVLDAWAYQQGPFTELELLPMWDLKGESGRSRRRNDGIAAAIEKGCDWLFFLDADDLMYAQAFEEAAPYLGGYDAVWGNICEMPYGQFDLVRLRGGQLQATEKLDDILKTDPFLTLQMGHFVRAACARDVGFDVSMHTGEDFRYYLQICARYRFIKAACILFINQRGAHSQGPLAADGAQWREAVQAEIRRVAEERQLVAEVELEGRRARFRIANPFDTVQKALCRGQFFEQKELLVLQQQVGPQKTIVEVGANIGNHVVFYAQHMNPVRIYPFEPNPVSVALLEENIRLNGIEGLIDRRGIGFGLGAAQKNYRVVQNDPNNLGAARLEEGGTGGDIAVRRLDDLLPTEHADFIKIDAEGMEFEVLAGAAQLIRRCRPLIYVEVWNAAIPTLDTWLTDHQYQTLAEVKAVRAINRLVGPC
ncbi:MAG TPA: FkbM family methyltransferase [Burkholderiales bacterium]